MAKLTTEDKKEIVRLRLKEGIPIPNISSRFGVNRYQIDKLIRRFQITWRKDFRKTS